MIKLETSGHRSLIAFLVFAGATAFVYIVSGIVTATSVSSAGLDLCAGLVCALCNDCDRRLDGIAQGKNISATPRPTGFQYSALTELPVVGPVLWFAVGGHCAR